MFFTFLITLCYNNYNIENKLFIISIFLKKI